MDTKNIEKRIKRTVLSALADAESPFTADVIDTADLSISNENTRLGIRLKPQECFRKNGGKRTHQNTIKNSPLSETLTVAMVYQNRPIGEIEIVLPEQGIGIDRHLNVEWIGDSDSSKMVDRFVERASSVDFPVLIDGEPGSGKLLTAFSIHCHSARRKSAFIESHCANWKSNDISRIMRSLWSRAKGGTLYLKEIDALKADQISKIRHYWQHVANHQDGVSKRHRFGPTRLIASISSKSDTNKDQPWNELDYLSITLPSLRDRREDIKEITQHYLEKLSHIKSVQLSSDCWELFERFDWSGNIQQLERLVSKVVVMSDSNYLEPSALLTIIPQLQDNKGERIELGEKHKRAKKPNIDYLANLIVSGQYNGQIDPHPALAKAISYLAENYTQDISLQRLSDISFVSPSHLSYLFKHHLGYSFKQLLILSRIKKSQQLLANSKHQKVTGVAYDVGFRDLSHFEKTFKRIVGVCPGKFKNRVS